MDLYTKAKKFCPSQCKGEVDEDLRKDWKELQKAGATLTNIALRGLAKRNVDSIWKCIVDPETSDGQRRTYLQSFFQATAPWASPGQHANGIIADPCSVTLIQACETDSDVEDLFQEWVFNRGLSEWLGAGNSAVLYVSAFVEEALHFWDQLPEDAVLGGLAAESRMRSI